MLSNLIEKRLQRAVGKVLPEPGDADAPVLVRPCPDPKFGDYQANTLMSLAKARQLNPRQLATDVVEQLDVRDCCEAVEIAGPGFLNFRLKPSAVMSTLQSALRGEHLFTERIDRPATYVIDFSSPNVAKPMHVGHIRSTILGDSLARTLRFLGHRVITDNHIGDWGTQFGKLILGWKERLDVNALDRDPIGEMERLYKHAHAQCEADAEKLDAARRELVKLQQGDVGNRAIWQMMTDLSRGQFEAVYGRLGVKFDHTHGESFYNAQLKPVADELVRRRIARQSEGAKVVFFDKDPALKDHPAIIWKSDGAANYATSDLATLAYRMQTWKPDAVVYVTDARQQLHFQQIFATYRRWQPKTRVELAHVWFGSILGDDGTPFKTRSGEVVKLTDLLDEAEERAGRVVAEKNPDLPAEERRNIARIVGIGAVKYADLLPNRQSDYVFSWDKMLALSGNTAPYLQYAYTRIRGIFRKLEEAEPGLTWKETASAAMNLEAPEELRLAKRLLDFGLVLESVATEYRPNYLCNYIYELAGHFTAFYEACPVLKAEGPQRTSRLGLCELTSQVLRQGLDLLGIEVADRM